MALTKTDDRIASVGLHMVTGIAEGVLVFGAVAAVGYWAAGDVSAAVWAALAGALAAGVNKGLHALATPGVARAVLRDAMLGLIVCGVAAGSGVAAHPSVQAHFESFAALVLLLSVVSGFIQREIWPDEDRLRQAA